MDRGKFVIGYNNTSISSEPCGLCDGEAGRRMGVSRVPLEVFVEGTKSVVCPECIEAHAPELGKALDAYYSKDLVNVGEEETF